MDQNIQKILSELYALDPELKLHEKSLAQIIQNILETRPDTKFDEAFARNLRTRLLSMARQESKSIFKSNFSFMNNLKLILSTTLVAALVIGGIAYVKFQSSPPTPSLMTQKISAPETDEIGLGGGGPTESTQLMQNTTSFQDTTDWQTYDNSDFSYSFKYPDTFNCQKNPNGWGQNQTPSPDDNWSYGKDVISCLGPNNLQPGMTSSVPPQIDQYTFDIQPDLTLNQWCVTMGINREGKENVCNGAPNFEIDDTPAYRFTTSFKDGDTTTIEDNIYFQYNGYNRFIYSMVSESDTEGWNILETILHSINLQN